jgi:hypothetical protein
MIKVFTPAIYNGVTYPGKWMLTRAIYQQFQAQELQPEVVFQLTADLKRQKEQGKTITNNLNYGFRRLMRFLGCLYEPCKDRAEITPDELMANLQQSGIQQLPTLRTYGFFTPRTVDPGPVPQEMNDNSLPIYPSESSSVTFHTAPGPTQQQMPTDEEKISLHL